MTKPTATPRRFSQRAERLIPLLLVALILLVIALGGITIAVLFGIWPS